MGTSEQIKKLKDLHERGALTDKEFSQLKARLLEGQDSTDRIPKKNEEQNSTNKRSVKDISWMVPVAIVFGVFLLFFIFSDKSNDKSEQRIEEFSSNKNHLVKLHGTYYIFISLIELASKNFKGKDWDEGGWFGAPTGPDLYYTFSLNDIEIYSTKNKFLLGVKIGKDLMGYNNYIKEWSGVSQEFTMGTGKVSPEGMIDAPLVAIEEAKKITVRVYDDDSFGLWNRISPKDDEAGNLNLILTELEVGENKFWRTIDNEWVSSPPASQNMADRGIKQFRVRVVDSLKKADYIAKQLGIPLEKVKSRLGL